MSASATQGGHNKPENRRTPQDAPQDTGKYTVHIKVFNSFDKVKLCIYNANLTCLRSVVYVNVATLATRNAVRLKQGYTVIGMFVRSSSQLICTRNVKGINEQNRTVLRGMKLLLLSVM